MPRIRTFKPEMPSDEKLAPLPPIDKWVFVCLVLMSDDAGRVLDNIKQIDAFAFPETEDSASASLRSLTELGIIRRGTAFNGQRVIQVAKFQLHQKIDKPNYNACLPVIHGEPYDAAMRVRIAKSKGEGAPEVPSSIAPEDVARTSPNVPRDIDDTSPTDRRGLDDASAPHTSSSSTSSIGIEDHGAVAVAVAAGASPIVSVDRTQRGWRLLAAAAAGCSERYGELPKQLQPSAKAVDMIVAAGVDSGFAIQAVREYARTCTLSEPPKSLAYFAAHVIERWRIVGSRGASPAAPVNTAFFKLSAFDVDAMAEARAGDEPFRQYCRIVGLVWEEPTATQGESEPAAPTEAPAPIETASNLNCIGCGKVALSSPGQRCFTCRREAKLG